MIGDVRLKRLIESVIEGTKYPGILEIRLF